MSRSALLRPDEVIGRFLGPGPSIVSTASGRSRHDQNVFLLKFGWGNPNLYHAKAEVNKVYKVRAALLSEAQLQELNEGERAHVENAVARNMFLIHLHI